MGPPASVGRTRRRMSSSDRMNDLSGHVVLVTGATDGLGRALCAELVELRAAVLVHGRSPERIEATVEELRSATATAQVRGYCADLASLAEVAGLARAVREGEPRLDALVSDAGIGTRAPGDGQRMESADRVELRFAVNYLAGYGLVSELLGLLRASAPARIVLVSSAGQTPLDFTSCSGAATTAPGPTVRASWPRPGAAVLRPGRGVGPRPTA